MFLKRSGMIECQFSQNVNAQGVDVPDPPDRIQETDKRFRKQHFGTFFSRSGSEVFAKLRHIPPLELLGTLEGCFIGSPPFCISQSWPNSELVPKP
eukprot:5564818-Amphidinium_carterae.1